MTADEILKLKSGTIIQLLWPGSNSGPDRKRARFERANRLGTKFVACVAKTTPTGKYTGRFGSMQWFDAEELEGVE